MRSLSRVVPAALLALVLPGGSLELHRAEHGAGLEIDSPPVFSSARHHQDPAHLEAAELSHRSDCAACLLLKGPGRPAARPAVGHRDLAESPRAPLMAHRPLDRDFLHRGSRAPPLS